MAFWLVSRTVLPLLAWISKLPPMQGDVMLLAVLPRLGLYRLPDADRCAPALFWAGKGYPEYVEEEEPGDMSPRERFGEVDMLRGLPVGVWLALS